MGKISEDVAGLVERLEAIPLMSSIQQIFEATKEAASTIRALVAENERLHDLFRIDGEQHATRIREMEKAHDARVAKYYEALEADRAKLRDAVEVMRTVDAMIFNDNGDVTYSPLQIRSAIRAFLATMEKQDG